MKRIRLIDFLIVTVVTLFLVVRVHAQTGSVSGTIVDEISNEPIPFANIIVQGTTSGAVTDFEGKYKIDNLKPGFIRLEISVLGYAKRLSEQIQIISNRTSNFDVKLEKSMQQMEEVVIESSPFTRRDESPLSMQTIGVAEIERAAGANRDISKVIQSLPGVASTPAFRNDIIIRGGSPNENRFYLDEIEVPNINHFQTQGASGGPVGLINVNLIREVDFQSGAFPANRGNMLSSLLSFKQLDGNKNKLKGKFTLGSSDLGLTLDGPLGKKTTFVFSVRQSYLQFLFGALGLPFLPTYWDYQTKIKYKINKKNEISLISIGALDKFKLNTEANETKQQRYILANLPVNGQWNYTIGAVYKHFSENSFQTFVVSRNMLNNQAYKYENNDESDPNGLVQDYKSQEIENKFRFEDNIRLGDWKLIVGVNYEYAKYNNSTYNRIVIPASSLGPARIDTIDYKSELNLNKYGAFVQLNRRFFGSRLKTSLGVRFDGNDYNESMANLLNQFAPRLGISYGLSDKWSINFATGRFTQLPAYTVMGYQRNGEFVNQKNGLKYITADHINGGVEWRPLASSKITLEGFYKFYQNYPLSTEKGISLANLGADFGIVGNEPVISASEGRAYGLELLAQQKLTKGFYGILSYTWVRSEFTNADGAYAPSSWDSEHLLTLTAGKKFKKNWEFGARWRYVKGRPYTPYLVPESYYRASYDINPRGVPDYTQVNSQRLAAFHQLDVRVDKTYNFKKWGLNLYLDIQNLYNFQSEDQPILYPVEDAQGNFVVSNPNAPYEQQIYEMEEIPNTTGTVLPTIGVIIDF
ncbi:MAG: ferric aerobactin receptor [Crocinitomicaceae bacterium]|nr:ferric aerobactin receptor [Crocinitomicaceae bacterium]